ncbi:Peptidase C48, SUMO/Sentrin/Ubl1 [Artemisia annua]|uniref:Peptidase C48, SUMO/Sentrin/Ubl1 n=1 Tax=Artemisia annua TaxID=35608 RepID=A0A2U1M890_ARTAN|nr:Peptidase C48, SUMO/Sentrin/Ubl1 [Artemisia annua]
MVLAQWCGRKKEESGFDRGLTPVLLTLGVGLLVMGQQNKKDEQIQNNFEISKEKEDSDVETTSFTSYDKVEIQQVHSNNIETSKEEQPVSPNFKQVVSDLKRCIHHFSLHDDILSKDEEVAQYKKELFLLFIGKDTPQIQRSSHEVSNVAISDQFVVDNTNTVSNEEGDKEEENVCGESEKLDLVVKKVAEDIILNSKDDSVDIEQSSAERVDTTNVSEALHVKTDVTTNADFQNVNAMDVENEFAYSVSVLQDDVTPSNGASTKMQLEVANISNVGIPASENASNIEGDSVEDEGLDKEVNNNLKENVFAGNDQNVTSETSLLQESEKSKVDIEQPLAERVDTINVGSHVTTDADFNVQTHSGEKGNVDVMDVPNEFSTESTEIDATDVQNVDAMCVQNVDAMNLQNEFSTSVMVGEELLQNVTMKEDLSTASGNGGCLKIQQNEDSDTISYIPDEASEKEINEHGNVNTDIMNVQPAAEELDLPTQDGLVVQTDVSSNADFHVDNIGVQNEVSTDDFQRKFVEFPESPEGQSNDEIFTEDSKKENDKFEDYSAIPVTAELQGEIQTEDTSNIQMETLDVQNAGCLKIKDFEECDTISDIQEPTDDSSHLLPLEGIDMQMDNGHPISKTLSEPTEDVFAMNGNVKTIDSPHSLAMERSEMHIDDVPHKKMKVNIEEEIPLASPKGGCVQIEVNEQRNSRDEGSGEMMCYISMSACEEVHLDRAILMNDESSNEDVLEKNMKMKVLEKNSEHEDLSHLNALEKNSEDLIEKNEILLTEDAKDSVLNEPQTAQCIKVDHQSKIQHISKDTFIMKREGKKSMHFESPYVNKRVDTKPEYASQVEELFPKIILQNSIEGDAMEKIFKFGNEDAILNVHIQSLASENEVEREIIDNFVNILNFEEKLTQQHNKSFRRFFKTQIIPKDMDEYHKDSEGKVNEFNNYVFFPILAYEHFYVIVFNIRNGYAIILDNLKSDAPNDGKYKKVFEFVKSLLVDFLARNNYTNTNLFSCEKDAKVLNLRWKTRNDKINCGLYAMIHMELYEFEDEEWEIGILDEEDAQHRIQMDVLRNRYITKILLHEINQHKRKMIHFVEDWISEYPDEFEEEGTEAKIRRIHEEDCLKEIFFKGCKYRRNFAYNKIVGVDCEEVDEYPKSYSVTLNDKSKHKLSASELQNFGFQEWNEFMFCIFLGSLNVKMKRKIMTAVLKLLTMAKMMNEISVDEAYQSYIGLTLFKNPMKQWLFVQICKEVLVGDTKVPDGVVFEHLKYYKEPVESLCFLKNDRKQCFQTYSGVTNLPLLHMKDESSYTDGNNMKLIYMTDEKEMMDKFVDGNDQSKLVVVAAKALNELSNPQDIIDCPKPISFFPGSLSSDDDHFKDDDSYESEDIKYIEDDDFENEDSYESVHTQEDINKVADSIQNNEDLRDKVNRQRNPTFAMKSPFNIRKVNILCILNKREKSVLELIKKKNASNIVEKFFGSDLYCNIDRSYFKNLVNKTKHVTSNIIDIWAVVLNAMEKYRSPGSVLRLFFTTQAMFKLFCNYLKVTKYEMDWQTSKNKTDCGIFTMRHLEFYSGVEDKQWRSIFRKMEARMNWQH